jgi:hypothetical protein
MGWLFAVALGLQEGEGRAVWRALTPLALGHALAIAGTLIVAALLGFALSADVLKWLVAAALLTLGVTRLIRHRHPRTCGMRVNARDLTIWSMLMAAAHGAGLMVLPLVLDSVAAANCCTSHSHHAPLAAGFGTAPVMVGTTAILHTTGYLLATGSIAAIVYYKLGLRLLRTVWFNVDALWAVSLIVSALLTIKG